jgi:phosphate/sulfate permease
MYQNKIEEILQSIDGLQKPSPKPFMASRVLATIANNNATFSYKIISHWFAKPIIACSIIIVVLLLNFWVLNQNNDYTIENETDDAIVNNNFTVADNQLWNELTLTNNINEK